MKLTSHPLIHTLVNLKGNPRGAVFTEPLWGIPYNLYAPYVSVYMLSFGLTDAQIGLIATISLLGQAFFSFLSGAISDKLGRKTTTWLFDFISWSIPTLIWAIAQDFTYFVVAAIINSVWRVTHNSWSLVMVEDADPDLLVDIYAWVYISGQLVVFFSPIAGVLINQFGLVPTMRGLYLFACVMMTAKLITMNAMVSETKQGKVRMAETKGVSIFTLLGEYKGVLKQVLAAPQTLYTLAIMLVLSITTTIINTFWAVLVTEKIHIPAEHLAIYPFARSAIMLVFFFLVTPRVREMKFRNPMLLSIVGYIAAMALLVSVPEKGYLLLLVSVMLETCSFAILGTQVDRMVVVTVDPQERARIVAILMLVQIALTSPFGWIAGQLSEINRNLPFILVMFIFMLGAVVVYRAAKLEKKEAV